MEKSFWWKKKWPRLNKKQISTRKNDQFWQERNFDEIEIDQVLTDYYGVKEFDQVLITKNISEKEIDQVLITKKWEGNTSEKEIDQVLTGVYLVAAALLNKPLPLL